MGGGAGPALKGNEFKAQVKITSPGCSRQCLEFQKPEDLLAWLDWLYATGKVRKARIQAKLEILDNEHLYVNDFDTKNQDIVSYFSEVPQVAR